MRRRLDIAALYSRALDAMPETLDGLVPLPLPAERLVTVGEMLAEP